MRVQQIVHAEHVQLSGSVPEASEHVHAGFPSPAQDYWSGDLSLDELLMPQRAATYVVQAVGHSMTGAGIFDGDKLVVDRSIPPQDGHVVVAVLDGELTVKRLRVTREGVLLTAENATYPTLTVGQLSDLTIWGVVTWVLHHVDRQ